MMQIKAIAIMVLLSCALFFSGCAYKYLPCKADEPIRTYHKQCAGEQNNTKFGECASEKYILLEGDYEVLLNRFRSCK